MKVLDSTPGHILLTRVSSIKESIEQYFKQNSKVSR